MALNTFPCNPYPISTEELNKGNNDALNTRVTALEGDVSDLEEQKANQITIALSFNPETEYEVGDLVYYNGLTYRCTNAHTGEWDADDFAGTTIANELSTLKSGLTDVTRGLIRCYPIVTKNNYAAISLPKGNTYTIYGDVGVLATDVIIPDCRESGTDGFVVQYASATDGYYIIALIGTYADTYVGNALNLVMQVS